jgi:hypothetical protein
LLLLLLVASLQELTGLLIAAIIFFVTISIAVATLSDTYLAHVVTFLILAQQVRVCLLPVCLAVALCSDSLFICFLQLIVVGGVASTSFKDSALGPFFNALSIVNFDIQFGTLLSSLVPTFLHSILYLSFLPASQSNQAVRCLVSTGLACSGPRF